MSRILALAAVLTLLGVSACKSVSGEAPKPSAAQPAPETNAAAKAEAAAPADAEAKPASAVQPVEASPAAKPASTVITATPEPVTPAPAVAGKPEAPATPTPRPVLASPVPVVSKEQAMALAAKGNCVACHKIESRLVGPAWKDVAAKYRNDANAVSTIASHIKSGGSFGWKFGAMPPRGGSSISDADVATLARFIAGLK